MTYPADPRVALACEMTIRQVVDMLPLEGLQRQAGELIGPCPKCGGHDRFGISLAKGVFGCRKCGGKGDALELVRHVLDCSFMDAVSFLAGDAVAISPAELERRLAAARIEKKRADDLQAKYRDYSRKLAVEIWRRALPWPGTAAQAYLEARGIEPEALDLPLACFRFIPDHPYSKKIAGRKVQAHCGPALIAAIQGPEGRLQAVHQTWIDLGAPKAKAAISHPDFEGPLPSKTVQGSKKGGAIRLTGSLAAPVLIMGEGIETTGAAMMADPHPGAAFWVGVDLGNMAGLHLKVPGKRFSGQPDLSDGRAFVPPDSTRRLIYIQDGDSDPETTRAQLLAGLRRAMKLRPGLRGQIVHAGAGLDLNDVLQGAGE